MTKEDVVQIRVEDYTVGKVPPRVKLIQWLEEAIAKQ